MTTHLFIFLELKQTTKSTFWIRAAIFFSKFMHSRKLLISSIFMFILQSFKNYHIPHSKLHFWLLVLFSFLFSTFTRGFLFHSFHFYLYSQRTSSWIQVLVLLFLFSFIITKSFQVSKRLRFFLFITSYSEGVAAHLFSIFLRRYLLKRA